MSEKLYKQFNHLHVEGNITKDPVLVETKNGKKVTNFVIANNDYYTNGDGEKVKEVTYYKVTAWGVTAENIAEHRKQGSTVIVSGKPRLEKWEKDGKRNSIIAITPSEVHFR